MTTVRIPPAYHLAFFTIASLGSLILLLARRPGAAAAEPPEAPVAPKVSLAMRLTSAGVAIEAGSLGNFTLAYPVLVGERWDQVRKPIEQRVNGSTATVQYDSGAKIAVSLDAPRGELVLTPAGLPSDAKSVRLEMLVDFSYANGGSWKIGDGPETPFPCRTTGEAASVSGQRGAVYAAQVPEGAALNIQVPPFSYQQLTDNREWGWKTFHWQFNTPNVAPAR